MLLRKNDIIERLSQIGYTKKASRVICDDIFKVITEALVRGESIQIFGFGTFEVKDCAPRETVCCITKSRITIPAHKSPKFTAGSFLKRAVKEGFVRE